MSRLFAVFFLIALLAGPAPIAAQQPPVGQIVFAGPYGLWMIGADGRNEQLLNTGPNADMPSVSPDGKRIVYVIAGTPEAGAWIYDIESGTREQLSRDPWRWPSWSPDGRKIAFTLARPGGSDIIVYDLTLRRGGAITVDGTNESPDWWNDSSRILFSRNGEIWIARADGGDAGPMRGLVGTTVLQASWSPDGQRLAYLAVPQGRDFTDPSAPVRLYIGTFEGHDGVYIAQGNIDRTQRVSWSPDGTRLAFATFTGIGSDIQVVYTSGGDWIRISDGRNPVWRPTPATIARPISTTCALAPERMYAAAFANNPTVQSRIGCPTGDINTVDGAMQEFEGGFMYWRNQSSGASVWAFFNDGTWTIPDTTRFLPAPGPAVAPPPGRGIPRNAILIAWQAIGGPGSRLGWATGEEANFASDSQPYERGLAFAGNNRVVFVNVNGTYEVVRVAS